MVLPTPKFCPLCKRPITQVYQDVETVSRRGGARTHLRRAYECSACKIRVRIQRIPGKDPKMPQCSARESGGVRCELAEGHEGEHACPKALKAYDKAQAAREKGTIPFTRIVLPR